MESSWSHITGADNNVELPILRPNTWMITFHVMSFFMCICVFCEGSVCLYAAKWAIVVEVWIRFPLFSLSLMVNPVYKGGTAFFPSLIPSSMHDMSRCRLLGKELYMNYQSRLGYMYRHSHQDQDPSSSRHWFSIFSGQSAICIGPNSSMYSRKKATTPAFGLPGVTPCNSAGKAFSYLADVLPQKSRCNQPKTLRGLTSAIDW